MNDNTEGHTEDNSERMLESHPPNACPAILLKGKTPLIVRYPSSVAALESPQRAHILRCPSSVATLENPSEEAVLKATTLACGVVKKMEKRGTHSRRLLFPSRRNRSLPWFGSFRGLA